MRRTRAFTLIELIVALGIIGIITTFSFTSIFTTKHSTSFETSLTTLLSDIKAQQNKAMVGDTEGGDSAPQAYGIALSLTSYTLFRGHYYYPLNLNFTVNFGRNNFGDNIQLTNITFPTQAPANEKVIVFATNSGEIINFVNGQNSFAVRNTLTGQQKTVTINKYGTVISVN